MDKEIIDFINKENISQDIIELNKNNFEYFTMLKNKLENENSEFKAVLYLSNKTVSVNLQLKKEMVDPIFNVGQDLSLTKLKLNKENFEITNKPRELVFI
ncbi:MAG: hypothetical protein LBC17_01975, partial [Lactobacillaceae bacterium]|nr:hypothetical protein [Lactobacillaceae bacterium]